MSDDPGARDVALARLLRHAGHRELPPAELTERVYRHTHARWLAARKARQQMQRWSVAATVLVATVFGAFAVINLDLAGSGPAIALQTGDATLIRAGERLPLLAGTHLRRSDVLETGARPALIEHDRGGALLRLAPHSQLRWVSRDRPFLSQGQIYVIVDAHASGSVRLQLDTAVGSVRHIGTRFAVRVRAEQLEVAVRDGSVVVDCAAGRVPLAKGELLEVDRTGHLSRRVVPIDDDYWHWVDTLTPPLRVEGRDLHAVLEDVATRTGYALRFDDAAAEHAARNLTIHGPALELTAREAVAVLLSTTSLQASFRGDTLVILAK